MLLKAHALGKGDLFGRQAPLIMEAGFGDGGYLEHLARAHPECNLLGADTSRASVARAFRRMSRMGARHVRLFHGSAEFAVRNFIPESSLAALHVNFPDPWPKRRHRTRRLLQEDFFALLSTRLVGGGHAHLTTDSEPYWHHALKEAERTRLYECAEAPPSPDVLRTKYGKKWNALRRPIFHATFTKIASHPTAFPPSVTPVPMHHVLLTGSLPALTIFEPIRRSFDGGLVVVTSALVPAGDAALVFQARVEEHGLIQDVLIEARPTRAKHAEVFVGTSTFAQPLPTPGTREAVKAVTEWLVDRGLVVVETHY